MSCDRKQYGGAYLAPLSYLNHTYREPSSSAGPHALYSISEPGLARPSINPTGGYRARRSYRKIRCSKRHKHTRRCLKRGTRKGGFFPPASALGSFMQSGPGLVVPAGVTGYHMLRNYKGKSKTQRKRK